MRRRGRGKEKCKTDVVVQLINNYNCSHFRRDAVFCRAINFKNHSLLRHDLWVTPLINDDIFATIGLLVVRSEAYWDKKAFNQLSLHRTTDESVS